MTQIREEAEGLNGIIRAIFETIRWGGASGLLRGEEHRCNLSSGRRGECGYLLKSTETYW
jgi:hypothetical protein